MGEVMHQVECHQRRTYKTEDGGTRKQCLKTWFNSVGNRETL